jgi:hypothetical protein
MSAAPASTRMAGWDVMRIRTMGDQPLRNRTNIPDREKQLPDIGVPDFTFSIMVLINQAK